MPQTILSVDDDGTLRAARGEILRAAGFNVIEAAAGADAFELASARQPALVIIAVELPVLDGFAVAAQLKSDPRTAFIPALHISKRGDRHRDYPQSLKSGAEAYLDEPVEPAALIDVVSALTSRCRQVEEAMRESETFLRSFFDSPCVMRGFVDMVDGRVFHVSCNAAAAEMYGMDRESIAGKSALEAGISEELAQTWARLYNKSRRTGRPASMEYARRDALGRERWLLATASYLGTGDSGNARFGYIILDLTERKRAEDALETQREWLRVTLSSIGDAVLATDTEGKVIFLNPVAAGLTGWPQEQAIGQPGRDVLHIINEKTRAAAEDFIGLVLRQGNARPLANHTALVSRDGREIPVEDSAAPILDSAGNIRGAVLVFHDVTEKRRAQQALRESEAQFRTLANAIPQLCWMADAEGWIFWYNQRWYDYTGAAREQTEGWGWQSVHDPAELPKVLELWKGCLASGEPFDTVCPLRGADGVYRPFLTRCMPVRDADGKVTGWFGTNTDISEQKHAEEAARRASEQRRLALEAAQLGAWDYSHDSGIILWDERCTLMFGMPPGEIKTRELIALVHPDDRALVQRAAEKARAGVDGGACDCEFRVPQRDGSERWVNAHGRVYFTGEGDQRRPVRFIGVSLDITERKQAARRLLEAQKLESLGLLAGGVAHDFNNLLVGVIGNTSLAHEMLPADHPAADLLARVLQNGEQAAHLTRQMLAYSGKGRFLVEMLDLSILVPEMSGLVRPSISKKIVLKFELDADLPPIEADRGQVQQVFMNLTLNASEAMGSGDGLITIRTGVRHVDEWYLRSHSEIAELPPGKYVCLEVCDTGCGMDDATRSRIFDPFFSTKFTGRGLGLAAVAGILRGHKGAVAVSSAPGKGSCFTVLFPAATRAAEERPIAIRNAVLRGTGVILIVDDEKLVREMAKRALERHGYTVLLAESGMAALDTLRRHPGDIALILLDLSMPRMSGEEAVPEFRKIRPGVKVLVSSGYSEAETMSLFKGQRVSGFIQKPYTSTMLAEKVRDCIE
jgi:PAS domain S-box-containing protein